MAWSNFCINHPKHLNYVHERYDPAETEESAPGTHGASQADVGDSRQWSNNTAYDDQWSMSSNRWQKGQTGKEATDGWGASWSGMQSSRRPWPTPAEASDSAVAVKDRSQEVNDSRQDKYFIRKIAMAFVEGVNVHAYKTR